MKPSKNAFVYTVRMLAANRGGSLRRANLTYHILICSFYILFGRPHPRPQLERVVEEGKVGRVLGIFALFTCVVAEMSAASPRDAVPAAGPLCTHGKDTTGLEP